MKKERKKKEEKEQNRHLQLNTRSNFLTQTKVSRTLRVILHLDSELLLVCMLFALLLARLGTRTPIPYVQDAILNLRHPT